MADSSVTVSAGTGTNIDTRTEGTNGNHRQVIVVGDPTTNAGVAPVDATAGLKVDLGANNDVTVTSGTITAVTAITNALPAGTNAIGKTGHDITGIGHGVTTVTTAGTDVALAASTVCKKVIIQSQTDNTGLIAIGTSGVDATIATGTGVLLYPGDAIEIEIDNLADVYLDSTVNGEGVRYTYFT